MQASDAEAERPLALVVDDEDLVRDVMAMTMEAAGYTVKALASGEDALAVVAAAPEDVKVVVLDLTLDGMSGAEAFVAMRELSANLPVLLVSGFDRDTALADVPVGREGAPDAFLQKPYRPNELQQAVEALIARAPRSTVG